MEDLRRVARRRAPQAVFDYTDGGAGNEHAMVRSRQAFDRVEFHPSVARDVAEVDCSTTLLGRPSALPFAFAPTGFTRLMHTAGERAVASVAADKGIPYALSTMGTTSIEEIAQVAPDGRHWFQLYLWRDRQRSRELVERVLAAGYDALILTVDTPIAGARLRDIRNGLTLPPGLTLRTFVNGALRPWWWFDLLTTEPLVFASLGRWNGTVAELANSMFDPSVTLDEVEWLRELWPHKLVVKGILTVDDAQRAADVGVDAVVVSNHGGRQLDRAAVPLEQLPAIAGAVGERMEVLMDGGVISGADVAAALALGANGVLIGRAYLYGLMAGGQAGVACAVDLMTRELRQTMQLLGVTSVSALGSSHVRLRAG